MKFELISVGGKDVNQSQVEKKFLNNIYLSQGTIKSFNGNLVFMNDMGRFLI